MRTAATRLAACLAASLAATGAASAHHGWSTYDDSKTVTITAPISRIAYENPHGMVWLMHEGVEKEIYLAPPSRMTARGLEKAALEVGKPVTVEAYVSTRNPAELRAERITVDGKTTELR
jgi:hypothetical protein